MNNLQLIQDSVVDQNLRASPVLSFTYSVSHALISIWLVIHAKTFLPIQIIKNDLSNLLISLDTVHLKVVCVDMNAIFMLILW